MEKNLTIKVPASSANIGPGFDCLALALDIWNTVTVSSGDNTVSINGYGKEFLPKNQSNLIFKSFRNSSFLTSYVFYECFCTRGIGME